jgi:hypothetical protein
MDTEAEIERGEWRLDAAGWRWSVDYAVRFLPVAPRGVNAGGKLDKGKRMSPVWGKEELLEGGNRHRSCTRKPWAAIARVAL